MPVSSFPRLSAGGLLIAAALVLFALPAPLIAQEDSRAAEIVDTALDKRLERWEGVDDYTVYGLFNGTEVVQYYEKVTVDGRPAFRLVPPTEYEEGELEQSGLAGGMPAAGSASGGEPGNSTSALDALPVPEGVRGTAERVRGLANRARGAVDAARGAADEASRSGLLDRAGGAAAGAARGELQQQLVQHGMDALLGGAIDDGTEEAKSDARIEAQMFEVLAASARLAGTETVDGREAFVLVADDLTHLDLGAAAGEDTDFQLESLKLWLDTKEYVPLRTEMEMTGGGDAPPITIEVLDRDYRQVDGLYEPFERTVRSGGLMATMLDADPELQKKMEKAAKQLEEAEERMAQMPAAQREMMEEQFRAARQQFAGMARGEDPENSAMEMRTEEIVVNQGPPTSLGRGAIAVTGGLDAEIPRTIASLNSGAHPDGSGSLSIVQLIGAVEGELNAAIQINVPAELPQAGTANGQAALMLQWADGREAGLQSEPDAVTLTVTSRTSRSVHGEYEFDAAGPLTDRAGGNPREVTATVRGTFEAQLPRAAPTAPPGAVGPGSMDFTPAPGGYRQ